MEVARLPLKAALERVDTVIAHYGLRGLLVELKGRLLAKAEQWEEARTCLEQAVEHFRTEGVSLCLRAAMMLASVYQEI